MSRLIDADELQERMLRYYGDYSFNVCEEIRDFFQNTPTVKAIPIEWIRDIIYANTYLWEHTKERMFIDLGLMQIANYSITAQILSELIERWEKENA